MALRQSPNTVVLHEVTEHNNQNDNDDSLLDEKPHSLNHRRWLPSANSVLDSPSSLDYRKLCAVDDNDLRRTRRHQKQMYQHANSPRSLDHMEHGLLFLDDNKEWKRPTCTVKMPSYYSSNGKSTMADVDKGATEIDAKRLRRSLFVCNFCNSITQTMPVVLVQLIAAEQSAAGGATALVAAAAAVSTIGGAVGQFVNGFVCQHMGGKQSSSTYMMGMAACALLLAQATTSFQYAILFFSMEFLASIQWTSSSSVLFNHFDGNPKVFAAGITAMSLANTVGTLVAKAAGIVLLQLLPWRQVSQIAAGVAVLGAMVMQGLVHEHPRKAMPPPRPEFSIYRIFKSTKAVLGSRLFWILGLAHSISSLASTSDRVLGSFFETVSTLPRSICGGLTASVTLGFIHGVVTASTYPSKDLAGKRHMLSQRYRNAVVAALLLAASAAQNGRMHPYATASTVFFASGAMASSLSFQFYQIPNMVASVFGENQAVCLSFMDGVGYSMAAPIWAVVGKVVANDDLGWTAAWVLLAILFALGGMTMLRTLPTIWEQHDVLLVASKKRHCAN